MTSAISAGEETEMTSDDDRVAEFHAALIRLAVEAYDRASVRRPERDTNAREVRDSFVSEVRERMAQAAQVYAIECRPSAVPGDDPGGELGIRVTSREYRLIVDALDSHAYWQLSDERYRRDGFVEDPGTDDPESAEELRETNALYDALECGSRVCKVSAP